MLDCSSDVTSLAPTAATGPNWWFGASSCPAANVPQAPPVPVRGVMTRGQSGTGAVSAAQVRRLRQDVSLLATSNEELLSELSRCDHLLQRGC